MELTKEIKTLLSPIRTEDEYHSTLEQILNLMNAEEDSYEEYLLDLLTEKVEKYEDKHYKIDVEIEPIEAIKIRMEELNIKRKDLVGIVGDKTVISKLFNHKIGLSLNMIRNLNKKLNIPYSVLIK